MFLVSIARGLQFALLLLTLRLATTFLSPAEMGKVSVLTATVAFFSLLLLNPIGMFMNRRLHTWNSRGQAKAYFSYFWKYLFAVTVFVCFFLVLLHWIGFIGQIIDLGWLLFLVCGSLVFGTVNQVVIPGLNMFGYRLWFAILTLMTVALSLLFAVALTHTIAPTAEYWLSGLLGGQIIVGLLGKRVFFGKLNSCFSSDQLPKLSGSHLKGLINFSWPIAIAVVLGWVQSQGYRYLMERNLGLAELGLFVAGYGISSGLISGFESIFATYFQPIFYKKISNGGSSDQSAGWLEYAQAIIPAILLTGIFIVATAPDLTNILLGAAYNESAQFVVWGALAELGRITIAVFGMLAHARMNTKILLLPNFAGAVVAICLIGFLAPIYGSTGVGVGLFFSTLIALILTIIVNKVFFLVSYPLNNLLKSLTMGLGLIVFSRVLGLIRIDDYYHFASLFRLFFVGFVLMYFQYVLIRPMLRNE